MLVKGMAWNGSSWEKISVDTDGYLNVNVKSGALKSIDLNLDASKNAGVNVQNYPSNYPDNNVYDKLVEILTELNAKLETNDLNLDASKDLQTDVKTQGEKDRQLYGYDGSIWQKLGLLFGYNDVYSETGRELHLEVGWNRIELSPVPSDEIWIIKGVGVRENSASIDNITVGGNVNNEYLTLYDNHSPTSGYWYLQPLTIYLSETDYLYANFYNATAEDDGYMQAWGYKMKIS